MEAARTLTRESLFLEGRQDFFSGRALLFDRNSRMRPGCSNKRSERSIRERHMLTNALGIAYLEQAQFEKAIPAFRERRETGAILVLSACTT